MADIKVHVIHTICVIITYTLQSLSSLAQITHNVQVTINFKKKIIKKKHKKVKARNNYKLICIGLIWRQPLYISLLYT